MTYASPADLTAATGVTHDQLGLDSDADLTALLDGWLGEIDDLIDTFCRRSFTAPVPAGLRAIAREMGSLAIGVALQRRESPIVRVSEFTIRQVHGEIFTKGVKDSLKPYRLKGRVPFHMFRVRRADELEDA